MLRSDWNKYKIGTSTVVHKRNGKEYTHKYNLYSGNALLISIAEWTDDQGTEQYSVGTYFSDKDHMNNCLGLSKDHKDNILSDSLREIELSANYKYTPTIVQALAKAKFDNEIKITITPKAPW